MVMPPTNIESAAPRRSGGTSWLTATLATPKNTPWPQAEIRRVQVSKIRQLLFETDFPLKKIADLAGFEHVEYMCVVFKRVTGQSPGTYRKRVQAKEAPLR